MIISKSLGPAKSSTTAYIDRLQEHRSSRQRKVIQHDRSDNISHTNCYFQQQKSIACVSGK